ncbi:MAG TPA: hypothetical protein VH115_02675 [Solirubrobacteraceae bacterium]|nr:hypothetical protein [Solirubrobacteraceae bacterium]
MAERRDGHRDSPDADGESADAGDGADPREQVTERGAARARASVGVDPKYGRYVGLLVIVLVVAFTITTIQSHPNGAKGIPRGEKVPPFAVPLVEGERTGAADVATQPNQGAEGNVPACEERGTGVLNICELYERGPVVLALFVYKGGCEAVLGDMHAIAPAFPGVGFAAVGVRESRASLRSLVRKRAFAFAVGFDEEGILARRYDLGTCPQVTFVLPGGVVQSAALLTRPSRGTLRERVAALVAAARARGWRGAAG